ncbi:MAG: riboflavin synthase [Spirochaetaceae bacterium]|nr:MAG: riboflavin synthase [Spirochaetaceae bacterium]
MFTGIITEVGRVRRSDRTADGVRLAVYGPQTVDGVRIGDSIAIDGACQTVIAVSGDVFEVDSVGATIGKTTLGRLRVGDSVNLEKSLCVGDRLDGHFVQGHVSAVGRVIEVKRRAQSFSLAVEIPESCRRYVVPEGSIAIDGVSLTVAAVRGSTVEISVVPHTADVTTLSALAPGAEVNIETDILGRYVESLTAREPGATRELSESQVREWGFS